MRGRWVKSLSPSSAIKKVKMTVKWYKPNKEGTGWHKSLSASVRRVRMLKAHKGDNLAAGRAMQSLANVTRDKRTAKLAAIDARYFFKKLK